MKREDEAVGRNVPAFRRAGPRLERRFVQRHEALKERGQHVVVDAAAGELRVERLDLRPVADVQDAGVIAAGDGGLALGATAEGQKGEGGQRRQRGEAVRA